ncbi:MAG: ribonuclease P protein component [Rickettsiales bacterium]
MKNIISKISLRNIFVVMHKYGKKQNFDLGRTIYISSDNLEQHLKKYQSIDNKTLINNLKFNFAIRVPKKVIRLATKRNLLKRRFIHALYLYLKTSSINNKILNNTINQLNILIDDDENTDNNNNLSNSSIVDLINNTNHNQKTNSLNDNNFFIKQQLINYNSLDNQLNSLNNQLNNKDIVNNFTKNCNKSSIIKNYYIFNIEKYASFGQMQEAISNFLKTM